MKLKVVDDSRHAHSPPKRCGTNPPSQQHSHIHAKSRSQRLSMLRSPKRPAGRSQRHRPHHSQRELSSQRRNQDTPSRASDSDPETVPPSRGSTVDPYDDEDDSGTGQSLQSPSETTVDPLAARRALNLARGTAVSLNGGLSQYRPSTCMFASAMGNPCITRSDSQGIEFTIPGGPPGWEQNDEEPSVVTVVVIAPDGRSVLESSNN